MITMAPKKIGKKGAPIHSQGREIIYNIAQFNKREAEEGLIIPLMNIRERTLAATGISKNTYHTIMKEGENVNVNPSTSFSSPHKKRPRISRRIDAMSIEHIDTIRRIVYDFYLLEKRAPTLNCIHQKIKDIGLRFSGSKVTLWRLLKRMGFKWRATEDNRKILMESYDIRIKRIKYLKQLAEYRKEGSNIVYTDETYIHSTHCQSKGWYDETFKGLTKPVAKGQRLIIVHAGGQNGFISNGLLIFQSGKKTGDYHHDMNHDNFMKWAEIQLLPNLPPKSVLVVDNAPYHNVPIEKSITTASKKAEMQRWLQKHNITFEDNLTKPELYDIIKQHKALFPIKYRLDALLEAAGHNVLRLPPYHPQLNPIETIWAIVKNWVAERNVTFKLSAVEKLARDKFQNVSVAEWKKVCDHVAKIENEMMENEGIIDGMEEISFIVNTGSSEEDIWSGSDGEAEVIETDLSSDSDM